MTVLTRQLRVAVVAPDPVSQAGVGSQLRADPDLWVPDHPGEDVDLVVLIADQVDDAVVGRVAALAQAGRRVVVVVVRVDDVGLVRLVEAGACGLLRRADATTSVLTAAVRAASAGDGSMPADLLGRLLTQVRRPDRLPEQRRGQPAGLRAREVDVLSLLAEGCDNTEISAKLSYSERTVKSIVHDVCLRLQARNRTHAVAVALRDGLI